MNAWEGLFAALAPPPHPSACLAALRRALYGVAVGDALGADLEFRRDASPADLLAAATAPRLAVTDDTQMTLFVAEAVLTASPRRLLPALENALLRWYRLQIGTPLRQRRGLQAFALLGASRSPGMTCMSSLHQRHLGHVRQPNDSKGAGSLMRCAPLLLAHAPEYGGGDALRLTMAATRITHDHRLAAEADCFYVALLHAFAVAAPGDAASADFLAATARRVGDGLAAAGCVSAELLRWIERGLTLDDPAQIGGGWVAEEALAIAVSAARQAAGDFMRGMRVAICHAGDSDTTGAVAGALLAVGGVMPDAALCARLDVLPAILYLERLLAAWPQREAARRRRRGSSDDGAWPG